MPGRRTKAQTEAQEPSAFATLLEDWGFDQRPRIKTHKELAERLGIPVNTVNNWFAHGQQPRPSTLWNIARRTGIPIEEVRTAAGIPQEKMPPPPIDPWDAVYQALSATNELDAKTQKQVLDVVRKLHVKYEQSEGTLPTTGNQRGRERGAG
jgi:transcriptional regulator with XRE-family HTH domain